MSSAFENVSPLRGVDRPRTEELASKIEELLLDKAIKPGVRLGSKTQLCRWFRVAQGTLNEALRVLETRGVVELRRGAKGGVFAAAASLHPCRDEMFFETERDAAALHQCLAVATRLELLVAIEAAKSAQREAVGELRCLVDQMMVADPSRWFKWHCLFQRKLTGMGSNGVLTRVYLTLLSYLEQLFTDVAPLLDSSSCQRAVAAHRALVDAVACGDAPRAAATASVACQGVFPFAPERAVPSCPQTGSAQPFEMLP
ncbi:MAG: FadR family transcriptional regulator [Verrucomicrobia bacterium]|nr:FadR family transcriptional regulator [Verrucomicrobiota bacterium]